MRVADAQSRGAALALLKRAGTTIECLVQGGSMGLTLPHGTRLRLGFVDSPRPLPGDVIAFSAAGAVTVHRVVARGAFRRAAAYVLTRGDGSMLLDHPVHLDDVLGVVREWKSGETWQPVPPDPARGPRRVIRGALVWPVVFTLHLHHRLALALTASAVITRAAAMRAATLTRSTDA